MSQRHLCAVGALLLLHSTLAASSSYRLLRGGATPKCDDRPLTDDEISSCLNNVPTFSILTAANEIINVGGPDASPWDMCYSFFTDAYEAKELLRLTIDANPQAEGLHLGSVPLGSAFEHCGGWSHCNGEAASKEESMYSLQGPSDVVKASKQTLIRQLEGEGLPAGVWTLPVFFSRDFETEEMLPCFLSEDDLASGWVRAGNPPHTVPTSREVIDVRQLVVRMRKGGGDVPWSKVRLVSCPEAYELAQSLAQEEGEYEQEQEEDEEEVEVEEAVPMSAEEEMLRAAWDAEGSPFKGTPFDPSKVNFGKGGGRES